MSSEFRSALADRQRAYVLNLACGHILLTLMVLVHANDRRMPHGRADLYRRIVDLYLVRQIQQRWLAVTTKGEPMPHWDEREVRRALGYLAWRSQHKGAEAKEGTQRNQRQVIWSRKDLEQELRHWAALRTLSRSIPRASWIIFCTPQGSWWTPPRAATSSPT
jgi:predicted NACHT family NTPase